MVVTDSLQSLRVANGTIIQYGLDRVWELFSKLLDAQNHIAGELLGALCVPTCKRLERVGSPDSYEFEELSTQGVSQGSVGTSGAEQGYPLGRYGKAVAWDVDWAKTTTPKEFAAQIELLLAADARNISRQIKRALYNPTNRTVPDRFVDKFNIPVKALINADGSPIAPDINGNSFDGSTHQHFLASATLTTTALDSLINTVREHHPQGDILIEINSADVSQFTGLNGFIPLSYPGVTEADTSKRIIGEVLDLSNPGNRKIGYYNGYAIWVRPWTVANYCHAVLIGAGDVKPLVIRVRGDGEDGTGGTPGGITAGTISGAAPDGVAGGGDLQLVYDNPSFPLLAKEYRREFGISARIRTAAAVLRFNNASYAAPTFT